MKQAILFFLLLNVICKQIQSQTLTRNLVFEGAGIRGIAYGGVIKELENRDLLKNIERVGGTSAGAITALMISLGYNSKEIELIISSTSFSKFNDGNYMLAGGLNRMRKYYGWYKGQKFTTWLEKIIEAKTNDADISFSELERKGFKKLYVTGTSLSSQKLIVFSAESYPNMRVADAVRISMSIPLYFEPVFMTQDGEIVKRPKSKTGLEVMVDGGMIGNYPIRLFDSTKYLGDSSNRFVYNHETLGFRIDRAEQIANDSVNNKLAPFDIYNLKQYVRAFYSLTVENLNRQSLTHEDWERTVSIKDADISSRIRSLSKEEIDTLLQNGNEATRLHFLSRAVKASVN